MIDKIRQPIFREFTDYQRVLKQSMSSDNPIINEVTSYLSHSRGKELRPTMVLLSSLLFSSDYSCALHVAVALELLHTASLLHDDVVDETCQRRSLLSVNAKWNNKIAILAGDFFFSKSLEAIAKTNQLPIIDALSKLGQSLTDGELSQLACARHFSADEAAYYDIIEHKTADMFSFACYAGAFTATNDAYIVDKMADFGRYFGMAFQIKDDIFDYFENQSLGKPVGNDLREGKLTLPLIYALNRTSTKADDYRALLNKAASLSKEQVDEIYSFAVQEGGVAYAESVMMNYREKAIQSLSDVPHSVYKQSLLDCLEYCVSRHH